MSSFGKKQWKYNGQMDSLLRGTRNIHFVQNVWNLLRQNSCDHNENKSAMKPFIL